MKEESSQLSALGGINRLESTGLLVSEQGTHPIATAFPRQCAGTGITWLIWYVLWHFGGVHTTLHQLHR